MTNNHKKEIKTEKLKQILTNRISQKKMNNKMKQTKISKRIFAQTTQLTNRRILAFVGVPHLIQLPALTRKTTGRLQFHPSHLLLKRLHFWV
jgi:hypothetical protein